jgi:hypothetical protein
MESPEERREVLWQLLRIRTFSALFLKGILRGGKQNGKLRTLGQDLPYKTRNLFSLAS